MNKNFSENLKRIRKENNLSQEQLAEQLGVSRQAISKWESKAAYPEMDKIITLCNKFNLNIDDLLYKDIKEIKKEEESKKSLNKILDDFLNFITDSINLFSNMNFKSKIKCLFEQFIIIIILLILFLIINEFGKSIFNDIFKIFPDNFYYFLCSIFNTLLLILCTILSIVILIHIFKTRYLNYYYELKSDKQINKIILNENKDKIIIRDPSHSGYRLVNFLFKLSILFIKLFALLFVFGISIIIVLLSIIFIISFLLYKTGLFFIGLLITVLSLLIIFIIILLVLLNFILNRKINKKRTIYSFIISLISFGIGCGLIFIGTLDFDFLPNSISNRYIEMDMNDNYFFNYDNINYIESNNDNIKIEYKLNKYCNIKYSYIDELGIIFWSSCSNPILIINEFINNINNKKIISIDNRIYEINVYTSKENIEILKNNH